MASDDIYTIEYSVTKVPKWLCKWKRASLWNKLIESSIDKY